MSKVTLRMHVLPEFFGAAIFTIKAASDDACRRPIREFVSFYREHLFNDQLSGRRSTPRDSSQSLLLR